jgi:predicted 3-demethylubiquinone-9 3-methyltransferase (glyoxalase superfamily)
MTVAFQLDGQDFVALNGGPDEALKRAAGRQRAA